ncbi:TonB-dependent receptor [Methylolobus aquaticus]|nr:TonB-dependent receptor [Methylolobus aquaticus]
MHIPLIRLTATAVLGTAIHAHAAGQEPVARQLDEVVVTAARTQTPVNQIGSNVTVVTAEQIAERQYVDVADVLRYVAGLDVIRNGGVGQTTSVFMRGADARFSLVLIDGIEANDPANPGGQFDFANLMVDQIDRIEVVRGGESAIYGSDAIGGVINIITKKGEGKPQAQLSAQGGTYDEFKVGGDSSGSLGPVNYQFSASRFENRGFSAAARDLGNGERDGYRNTTVTAGLNGKPLDDLDLDWTLHYNQGHTKLDNCGGRGCDDPNNRSTTSQLFTRGQGKLSLFDGRWQQTLGVTLSSTDRQLLNPYDPLNPFVFGSNFDGQKVKVSWLNDVALTDKQVLTFGGEDEQDAITSDSTFLQGSTTSAEGPLDKSMNTGGVFLQHRARIQDNWFSTAGIRYDDNNISGSKVTWRTSQSIAVDRIGLRIKGNYGTGFKVPTLYQLFAPPTVFTVQGQEPIVFPALGNPNLTPERSRNWDIGLEQTLWQDRALVGASYFHNDYYNLIEVLDFSEGYVNVGRAKADGAEVFLQLDPWDRLSLRGQYTYMDTEQLPDAANPQDELYGGQSLLRRPRNKGTFEAIVRPTEASTVNLNVVAVGRKDDIDFAVFPAQRVTVPGYVIFNATARYSVNEHVELFARAINLLNKTYQEVYGYGTAGVSGFAGFNLRF